MSFERKVTITCPKCSASGEFVVWDTLNTEADVAANEFLLAGKLFTYVCKECKHKQVVNYDMLYHNVRNKYMITVVNSTDRAREAIDVYNSMINGEALGVSEEDKNYKLRIVPSGNQLIEKIKIFDAGLDDRAVELMKLFIVMRFHKQSPAAEIGDVLLEFDKSGPTNFVMYLKDGAVCEVDYNKKMYNTVAAEVAQREGDGLHDFFVDGKWAVKRFVPAGKPGEE